MITAIFRRVFYADLARGPSLPATDNRDEGRMFQSHETLIARRGQRVCNRDRETAARFERVHRVLANGPQK